MNIDNKAIGFALTGSFCTYEKIFEELKKLTDKKVDIIPIMSLNSYKTNSRFGSSKSFVEKIVTLTGKEPIITIEEAEPIGPKNLLDILIIAPCTGNTLAKLANGITDTPVLMAAKGHLRNNKPLVIALSSNDSLSMNLKNIGLLMNSKNIYFVPFGQDNYSKKPNSMISHTSLIIDTIENALDGIQIQPVIREF